MKSDSEFAKLSNMYFTGTYELCNVVDVRPIVDPSRGTVLAQLGQPSFDQVEAVVDAAGIAQSAWYRMSALARAEALHRVAGHTRALAPEIAEIMTRETGKPYKESADELEWAATAIDYYAELGRHSIGTIHGNTVIGQMHYTVKEPMGTVVSILPANFPILLLMWSAAAALAAGNSVVVKPSEFATITTLSYMRVFVDLPAGLVQCVTGGADGAIQLVGHAKTDMVAFTGSVPTAQAVAGACASTFKPHLIEASGSDAFIVMPSAPIGVAARGAAFASFLNCGQVCTSAEKIIVHSSIYDEFVEELVANVRSLRLGSGLGLVDLGPMGNASERDRLERVLARAIAQGASIRFGGKRPDMPGELANGYFFEPTILEGLSPEMDIFAQEIFGPVAPLYKVDSFDEAITMANASPFGLGANLYSKDIEEITRATNEIVAGMVWINAPLIDNDAGPFGGRKMSGTGRQLGAEGLDAFRQSKLIMIDPTASEQDFWWFPYKDEESWKETSSEGTEE